MAATYVEIVLRHTPLWAWAVLGLLVVLGARRLRTRLRRLSSAFLAPGVFAVWSVLGAVSLGGAWATATWLAMAVLGVASAIWMPGKRAILQPDGRFLFPGTPGPLVAYMAVFLARYGLAIWAGFVPGAAATAGLLAVALSAFMTGRTGGEAMLLIRAARGARPA